MEHSVIATVGDESANAIPVSPVRIDLGELRAPLHTRIDRVRFFAILALCLGLHVTIAFLLEPQPETTAPVEEAIPVEIIVEPPPEDAPAPQEEAKAEEKPPEPQSQPLDEKEATDFARSSDQDREDGKGAEQSKAEAKEPEPKPAPAPVEPEPPPAPDPAAEALPAWQQPGKPAQTFAALTPLPSFEFKAPLAKRTDGPRGGAEPGYLSTLYGLIMRKMERLPKPPNPVKGRVTFGIRSDGHIFRETVAIASGSPFLDAMALGAVRRAAPYPAPPKGGPIFIQFNYGSD